jgi:hypothetical protein
LSIGTSWELASAGAGTQHHPIQTAQRAGRALDWRFSECYPVVRRDLCKKCHMERKREVRAETRVDAAAESYLRVWRTIEDQLLR